MSSSMYLSRNLYDGLVSVIPAYVSAILYSISDHAVFSSHFFNSSRALSRSDTVFWSRY